MTLYPPDDQLTLVREELAGLAELQSGEVEGLDRKGTTILAANGVVLGLVLSNVEDFHDVAGWAPVFFNVALVGLAVGLLLGVWQLWPRKFKVVPEPKPFVKGYYAKPWNETMANLISAHLKAFGINKALSAQKSRLLKGQMVMLAGGGVLLVAAYLTNELLR